MKLAKTIQLDVSDNNIFLYPAKPEEWAITGTFAFVDSDPNEWSKKYTFAFQSAWLGLVSYGNSTFVQVTKISKTEYEYLIESLAEHLVEKYCAPTLRDARQAAKNEIDDMIALCSHPTGTLLSIERSLVKNGIKEQTRILKPRKEPSTPKVWDISSKD
jgi:hypothetical protein